MSLKRNFSIGLVCAIWNALLSFAVIPVYLKYLGTESYGLIGFFATTQALLHLLDLGLSPTINREVARCSAVGNMQAARNLLYTLSFVYWVMAVLIGILILVLAPIISNYWLQANKLSIVEVTQAIMLMGLVVASRWPVSLYMGALMGMQRVALSSIVGSVFATMSSLGAVVVLMFVSTTIQAFFTWQACVGGMYALTMHFTSWHFVGGKRKNRQFSINDLKRIWKFSIGMSGLALTGVILIQMDKVLLSKLLSLEEYGKYMVAAVVANGLYIVLTPLFNALYPRMTALVASKDDIKLVDLYKTGTRLFLAVLFPVAVMASIFSTDLLYLWTRNHEFANSSSWIVSLFLIGTTINGVMHFPYALQLAYGHTKLPLKINLILIFIMVPMLIILANLYGAVGGAGSWALLNVIYLFIGTWLTHKVLLVGEGRKWLIKDVLLPLGVSVLVGSLGLYIQSYGFPIYLDMLLAILLVCVAFTITVIISPRLKEFVLTIFNSTFLQVNKV